MFRRLIYNTPRADELIASVFLGKVVLCVASAVSGVTAKASTKASIRTARRLARDQRRRLRAAVSAILSPTLLVRAAVPLLGKPLTGDAYRLRRSLCELSLVYRVCVHFL